MDYCALLASGRGIRMGKIGVPKQFLRIKNVPLIVYTMKTILKEGIFSEIYIGILEEHKTLMNEILDVFFDTSELSRVRIVNGGETRMETFFNILKTIEPSYADYICMTDANRPLISSEIYERCMDCAKKFGMCCPAHPVVDGVCCVKDGVIYDIPDKSNLYAFQTPECFNYGEFEEIYSAVKNREKYLGIAELFLAAGKKPHIILSDDRCFKVTTPIDLDVLNVMLQKG